jgi:hypothetical protein
MRRRRLDKRAVRHSVKLLLRAEKVHRRNARLHRHNARLRPHAGRVRHLLEKMLPSRIANLRGDDKGVRESLDNVVVVR